MTLPDDLRRQVHRDAGAPLRTLGLLEAAADEIERLQRPDDANIDAHTPRRQ